MLLISGVMGVCMQLRKQVRHIHRIPRRGFECLLRIQPVLGSSFFLFRKSATHFHVIFLAIENCLFRKLI